MKLARSSWFAREMQLLLPTAFSPLTECFPAWKNQVDAQSQTLLRVVQDPCMDPPGALVLPPPPPANQTAGRALSFLTVSVKIYGALEPHQKQIQSFTVKSKWAEQ